MKALLGYFRGWLMILLIFVPLTIVLHFMHVGEVWQFASACLAIIPLAGLMGRATEHLAERAGTGIGGLLNATFGNAAELIIAIAAINAGLLEVVKASLTGSILGNLIFVLGASLLAGGLRYRTQKFNAVAAGSGVTMMSVAVMAMLVPGIYHHLHGKHLPADDLPALETMSLVLAGVMILNYVTGLVFSLRTHKEYYNGPPEEGDEAGEGRSGVEPYLRAGGGEDSGGFDGEKEHPPVWAAVTMLAVATAVIAVVSEMLVKTLDPVMHSMGWSPLFVGAIIIAVIGNAAEHSTAVLVAMRNKMDLAMQICIGSSMQIAMFVVPVLVFVSWGMGKPMTLEFTPVELLSVFGALFVVNSVANDGESNWFEGAQLISLYVVLAVAFYFM